MTVSLLRVRDEAHLWSQLFDREATSLLSLQAELSAAIAEQIRLTPVAGRTARRPTPPDRERVGLRRLPAWPAPAAPAHRRRQPSGDRPPPAGHRHRPGLRPGLVGSVLRLHGQHDQWRCATGWRRRPGPGGRTAGGHPRPVATEAQTAYGYERWLLGWDWPAAEAALRLAVELDPSNVAGHRHLGHLLSQRDRVAEAATSMARARELNPLDSLTWGLSARVALQARDLPAATAYARRAIALDPQQWIGYMQLAQAYEAAGEPDLALEALTDAERLANGNSKVASLRGYVLARMGRTAAAREVVAALAAPTAARYVPPYAAALVYAGLGEREAMFEALERALAAHDVHLMFLPVDGKWDPYRTDPRFVSVLARCRFGAPR